MNLQHVAVIPDGNRRWAKLHHVPILEGHRRGAEVMHHVVEHLISREVKYLTAWGFSTDNWKRSDSAVSDLFHLLAGWIERDAPWLNSKGVRLRHIGRISGLPESLQLVINQAVKLTKDNTGMTLNLAFNYTGRAEIVDAISNWLIDKNTPPCPDKTCLDEELFSRYLYTAGMPDVDLVIRTAGEFRLSNFMLWQTAYSEYYFSELLWPDFSTVELDLALEAYSQRRRRFGGD